MERLAPTTSEIRRLLADPRYGDRVQWAVVADPIVAEAERLLEFLKV